VPEPGELVQRVRARVAGMPQKPEEKAPGPQPDASAVGSCAAHVIPESFARELEERSELEEFQRKKATEMLKQALARIKPWARKVVVDRVARRKTSAQLAEESGMPRDQVDRIIAEARSFVRKYTNYFDDDWFWADTCSQPKLLPGQ